MLTYAGVQIIPMAQPFIYKQLLQLNTKLFHAKINNRKVVITFAATALFIKFSKDILTSLIPQKFGIIAYKDLTSWETKDNLYGAVFIVWNFH